MWETNFFRLVFSCAWYTWALHFHLHRMK